MQTGRERGTECRQVGIPDVSTGIECKQAKRPDEQQCSNESEFGRLTAVRVGNQRGRLTVKTRVRRH